MSSNDNLILFFCNIGPTYCRQVREGSLPGMDGSPPLKPKFTKGDFKIHRWFVEDACKMSNNLCFPLTQETSWSSK